MRRPMLRLVRGVALLVAVLPVFARAELDVVDAFPELRFSPGLDAIVGLATPPGRSNELFVTGQNGQIFAITNLAAPTRTVFLDLSGNLFRAGPSSEAGLVGLAFHPQYALNGEFFVHYTRTNLITRKMHDTVSRFRVDPANPSRAEPSSEQALISQADVWPDRQGGDLQFGPDGYLYVSLGDGGGHGGILNAQRIDKDFFSGILRLDVDQRPGSLAPHPHAALGTGYRIPPDNPYVGSRSFMGRPVSPNMVRTEFWAVGLRNPLRMSFDTLTGELYAGDVGEARVEEVDRIVRGGNYGWNYFEGTLPFSGARPLAGKLLPPLYQYAHSGGEASLQGRSVVGGLVYRGNRYPELQGKYVFGDRFSRRIWAITPNSSAHATLVATTEYGVTAFAVHPGTGEILMVEQDGGRIMKLVDPTAQEPRMTSMAAVESASTAPTKQELLETVKSAVTPEVDVKSDTMVRSTATPPDRLVTAPVPREPTPPQLTAAPESLAKQPSPPSTAGAPVALSPLALSVPVPLSDRSALSTPAPASPPASPVAPDSGVPGSTFLATLPTSTPVEPVSPASESEAAVDSSVASPAIIPIRAVWELGTDEAQPRSPVVPYHEFGVQNDRNDPPPGGVTRLPGDPQYLADFNPGPDDDFYFAGNYPPGFNTLGELLEVPNDEPTWAWERSLTAGDPVNRIHFTLAPAQVISGSGLRLSFEFGTGGSMEGGVFRSGFSIHDVAVRFRNGLGVRTPLYVRRLARPTAVILEFTTDQVAALEGPNSIEFVRSGPTHRNTAYWLDYDFVKLEAVPPVRSVWQIGTDEDPRNAVVQPYREFGAQNEQRDPPPGAVTHPPEASSDASGQNPGPDDDFYFAGTYPAGFNGLTQPLVVAADEPSFAWERSLTVTDPINRIHFQLTPAQVASGAWLRLGFEFPAARSAAKGVFRPGFASHDVTVTFVNSQGVRTSLYAKRLTRPAVAVLDFKASDVRASAGPNTLEFARVGPLRPGMSYWLAFDYVKLQTVSATSVQESVTRAERERAASALRTARLRAAMPEIFAPGRSLGHGVETVDGVEYLTLTYARPEPAPEGVIHRVEVSEDLVHWTAAGVIPVESRVEGGLRILTERDSAALRGKATRFLRLRVIADEEITAADGAR